MTDDAVRFSAFLRLWNVTGQPALSIPVGTTTDGVPVAVQLVGPPGGERLVLSVAAQLEHALDEQRRVAAAAGDSLATHALTWENAMHASISHFPDEPHEADRIATN